MSYMLRPETQRKALIAWGMVFNGATYGEVAARLGCSNGRVPQLLWQVFRQCLQPRIARFRSPVIAEIPSSMIAMRMAALKTQAKLLKLTH